MTPQRRFLLGAVAATLVGCSGAAALAATVLPGASYNEQIGTLAPAGQTSGPNSPSTFSATITGMSDTYGTATTSAFPNPAVTAVLRAPGPFRSYNGAYSAASVSYDFSVVGPQDVVVPIDLVGDLSANASEGADLVSVSGILYIDVVGGASGYGIESLCSSLSSFNPCEYSMLNSDNIPVNETITLTSNQIDQVNLEAAVYAGQFGNIDASVTVDPYLQIDPAWLANNPGYSLAFSDGISNLPFSAVPEPAAWAMMLLGVGMIGGGLRKARGRPDRSCGGRALTAKAAFQAAG